jgi:hypothetical protein
LQSVVRAGTEPVFGVTSALHDLVADASATVLPASPSGRARLIGTAASAAREADDSTCERAESATVAGSPRSLSTKNPTLADSTRRSSDKSSRGGVALATNAPEADSPTKEQDMILRTTSSLLGFAAVLVACSSGPSEPAATSSPEELSQRPIVVMPSIGSTQPPRSMSAKTAAPPATGNGIDYHGGPIMSGTVNIYYIWYGSWGGTSTPAILDDWANSIGASPIYRINTTYSDSSGRAVSGNVHFAGSASVGTTHGTNLADGDIWSIVNDALSSGSLPVDPNGVYFVLTSSGVTETGGFCTSYCGWHTARSRNGVDVKYSFIGDPARCNGTCGSGATPNGNPSADFMASIIFHELSESVSDPLINAWYTSNGSENGDLCAWKFGATYRAPNGANANVHLGNRDYLLQEMWLNANGGSCALSGGSAGRGDVLPAGSSLGANQAIVSPDAQTRAVMQPDGNFVVYQSNLAVWATQTNGSGADHAAMQTDGNFVVYAGTTPKWASNTYMSGGNVLQMQNDGNLVIYGPNGAVWASNTDRSVGDTLSAGGTLDVTYRLTSQDGRFEAIMQPDSNFVVYMGSTPLWATGLGGGTHATMQNDGNFVIYNANNGPVWASGTYGSGGTRLTMQNDGNLVVYTASGAAVWASGTSGH